MKSITVHGIDDQMDALLRDRAGNEGLSLNKTIKKLLAQSLGIKPVASDAKKKEFMEFFDTWSEDEALEFLNNTKDLGEVDEEEWS